MRPVEGLSSTGPDDLPQAGAPRRSWRAFRPLILYLIVALPILGWDIHRRLAARTFLRAEVNLESKSLEWPLQVEVDGKAVLLGAPVPIGSRQIKLWSRDTEAWQTNRFVWYGDNPLGTVQLQRSRGDLRVAVKPAPSQIALTGRLTNATSHTAEAMFKGLPVGDYRVELRFPHFTRTVTASVSRNMINTLDRSFPVGHLKIEAEPAGASYELQSAGSDRVQLHGQAPAEVSGLPPGEYRLVLSRGDYRLTRTVTVGSGQTNEARVVFEYGKVEVVTEPTNAAITLNYQSVGKTPLVLESLVPGRHTLRATHEGFHPVEWTLQVTGNETTKVSTNLLSVRYTEAVQRAKNHLYGFSRDYRAALSALTEALAAKPGDAEAAKLKEEAQFQLHNQDARNALSIGQLTNALQAVEAALAMRPESTAATGLKTDIERAVRFAEQRADEVRRQGEARLAMEAKLKAEAQQREEARRAMEAKRKADQERAAENLRKAQFANSKFAQVMQKVPKNHLQQRWTTKATPTEVEAALPKAIGQNPDGWRVKVSGKEDVVVQVQLEGAGLAEVGRFALVQLAPLDGGTEVRAVFYTGEIKLLAGFTLKVGEQDNLGAVARIFRERLEKQLGKPLR